MALADLMNADLATVAAQFRAGFAWWTDELAAMVPAALRAQSARAGVVAQLSGADIAYLRDGRALAAAPRGGRVTLALPRAQALVREVVLPRLPRGDTRRLVALDLDRLTPLDPTTAVFDFAPAIGEAPPGRQLVRLAVITRATATAALARAAALGLAPQALAIADGEGGGEFDFLPALAEDGPRPPAWALPRTWWIAAAVLLLANLAFAIWRDSADVARLRSVVDTQSDAVQLAQRSKALVRTEDAHRSVWAARRSAQDPLGPLAAATKALPAPVWVQRLAWDGHALRLTGFTRETLEPIALLRRSRAFASVHASTSDVQPALPPFQPFDLTAAPAPATITTTTSTSTVVRR